ncbi:hypothetical protein E1B28_003711 [Marasmius oreades]|uniref:Uncharacterized protein n=1 Tax=Marasmius oreades TaxID=181124 RepID=A0A9P7UX50_9AGAR|nr:uncharacterized protein E1B28_003711 [Marasmius oreades]KAG7096263.1 hypothetical protein E1B28_003711 [Marasmius oreades]
MAVQAVHDPETIVVVRLNLLFIPPHSEYEGKALTEMRAASTPNCCDTAPATTKSRLFLRSCHSERRRRIFSSTGSSSSLKGDTKWYSWRRSTIPTSKTHTSFGYVLLSSDTTPFLRKTPA